MFYETAKRDHGLPHDPFKAIVAPRPIGWISTLSANGAANLAPYSFFNAISGRPEMVMFSSEGEKDSIANIRETGEFVVNYLSETLVEAMNATSSPAPHGTDEFALAGLEKAACRMVRPPRVAAAFAALECRRTSLIALHDIDGRPTGAVMAIGQVVGVHIDEAVITAGMFDVAKARPVARLGYRDYMRAGEIFSMDRPSWPL